MELEGNLKSFSLLEILQFLSIGKLTGILSLSKGTKNIVLFIRAGKVVYSSEMKIGEKICSALVGKGLIKRADYEDALLKENSDQEFCNCIKT